MAVHSSKKRPHLSSEMPLCVYHTNKNHSASKHHQFLLEISYYYLFNRFILPYNYRLHFHSTEKLFSPIWRFALRPNRISFCVRVARKWSYYSYEWVTTYLFLDRIAKNRSSLQTIHHTDHRTCKQFVSPRRRHSPLPLDSWASHHFRQSILFRYIWLCIFGLKCTRLCTRDLSRFF